MNYSHFKNQGGFMRHLIMAAIIISLSGCANRIGDFTLISSKNIDFTHGADFKRGPARVHGEDVHATILGIPTGIPNMKTAMDHAIEKTPGAVALTDAVITQKMMWFILFGQMGYEVEGTPLIDPAVEKTYK